MTEVYAFYVIPRRLEEFLAQVRKSDDMGGNDITMVKDLGEQIMVVIQRKYSYPFVLDQLHDLERKCRA